MPPPLPGVAPRALLGCSVALLCAGRRWRTPTHATVWDALRAPSRVVVLRRSYASGSFDLPDARLDDCSTQRNLDEAGRAQARRIGDACPDRVSPAGY